MSDNVEALRRIGNFLARECFQPRRVVEDAAAPVIVKDKKISALAIADFLQMIDDRRVEFLFERTEKHDLANDAARLKIIRNVAADAQGRKIRKRSDTAPGKDRLGRISGIVPAKPRAEQARNEDDRTARVRGWRLRLRVRRIARAQQDD